MKINLLLAICGIALIANGILLINSENSSGGKVHKYYINNTYNNESSNGINTGGTSFWIVEHESSNSHYFYAFGMAIVGIALIFTIANLKETKFVNQKKCVEVSGDEQ